MLDIVYIVLGLVGLYYGAEWLVSGSSRTALFFKIPAVVIGLTIVAVGTSTPELVVSTLSAIQGNPGISLGNVVGSNIANIGLILGVVGLVSAVIVKDSMVKREIPVMIIVSIIATVMLMDGEMSRIDGAIFVIGFVVFTYLLYALSKGEGQEVEAEMLSELEADKEGHTKKPINIGFEILKIVVGLAALMIGAQFLVDGASNIARAFGVSESLIGLTLVAVGTSLPEFATSLNAAFKGENDIAVGNIVGSNIANLLLILGGAAVINPINAASTTINMVDYIMMIGFAALMIPFARNGKFSKVESGIYLGIYIAYVAYSFLYGGSAGG